MHLLYLHIYHMCVLSRFSHVLLFAALWTVTHQAPLSMGLSRQKYWHELPFPAPGDLPDSGIESASLKSPALGGGFFTTSATWEALINVTLAQLRTLWKDWDGGSAETLGQSRDLS